MRPTELREDLKGLPDDVREAAHDLEAKLDEKVRERPALSWALDIRVVLTAAVVALVIALVLRLVGLGYLPAILVFFILFAGLWAGISSTAAPRRSNFPL